MLQINNLEAVYQKIILALRGMSLHVPEGKIVALLGSNGAGKSTTLKSISGLLTGDGGQITDGTIEFEGKVINGIAPDVPIGEDDSKNVEEKRFGEPLVPAYEIPYHSDIMAAFNGLDKDLRLLFYTSYFLFLGKT